MRMSPVLKIPPAVTPAVLFAIVLFTIVVTLPSCARIAPAMCGAELPVIVELSMRSLPALMIAPPPVTFAVFPTISLDEIRPTAPAAMRTAPASPAVLSLSVTFSRTSFPEQSTAPPVACAEGSAACSHHR